MMGVVLQLLAVGVLSLVIFSKFHCLVVEQSLLLNELSYSFNKLSRLLC